MEWVLQVADELDDAVAALRHRWLGINGEMGALIAALRPRGPRTSRRSRLGRAARI
jgi:hypothetical protein